MVSHNHQSALPMPDPITLGRIALNAFAIFGLVVVAVYFARSPR